MITSRNNPKIKNIMKLSKASERRNQNLFVVEGAREISRAKQSGFEFELLLVCPDVAGPEKFDEFCLLFRNTCEIETINKSVFEKMAYREGSDGLIALVKPKLHNLGSIQLGSNPLVIVLEAVEKPGNLGAVLRTADAAGVDAVIISDPNTDIYNPNVIRSSIGCIFSVPVAVCSSEEAIEWLQQNKISSFATTLEASIPYTQADFTKPTAIVMGTEATGLSGAWLQHADRMIIIPMKGIADSLNVSTSAAIVVFEAVRQRGIG
ncbi:MAG: RNA methyltransferase [Bacteroidales bacterium]|nr:RNA methyltransferase [Bacteroidales bacterium]